MDASCLDRVPAVVAQTPELKDKEPFKTVLSDDRAHYLRVRHPTILCGRESESREQPRFSGDDPRRHVDRNAGRTIRRGSKEVD